MPEQNKTPDAKADAKITNTYCPHLWEMCMTYPNGDAYACCIPLHVSHYVNCIGNIYEKQLSEIWNDTPVKKLRQQSLDGTLACYHKCKVWNNEKKPAERTVEAKPKDLKFIELGIGERCNISCIMCFQDHGNSVVVNPEAVKENIDFSSFEDICLWGGEPLCLPQTKQIFKYIAETVGKKVSMETNGMLIDDEWAKLIAKHGGYILFSLNAATKKTHELINRGSKWEKVLENIQKIRQQRAAFKSNVRILGHMTIVKENLSEIAMFIKSYKELGFDEINFNYDSKVFVYLNEKKSLKEKLKKEIQLALKNADMSKIDLSEMNALELA